MIRTYFCYFAKRNCSSDCKCNAAKTDNTVRRDIIYGEVFKGDKQKDLANAITATVGAEVVEAIGAAVKTKRSRQKKS
jgi:RNA-binding protein YhbY